MERPSQQDRVDKDLYWCRILENSWSRTVLHEKRHWRVVTNYRTSDMSWVHFATRRNNQLTRHVFIRVNTKIGPVFEDTTSYLQGKYGVEIRIESVNKDNSHSWVRFCHGLNKLVTDLIDKEYDDNEQETSETKSEEFALKMNVLASASRPKAKARPRRPTSACSSARTVPDCERRWTDIEPGSQSNIAFPVAKKDMNTLLRHGQLPREEDGALEFGRLKDYLRRKSQMQGGWGNKKRFF